MQAAQLPKGVIIVKKIRGVGKIDLIYLTFVMNLIKSSNCVINSRFSPVIYPSIAMRQNHHPTGLYFNSHRNINYAL